MLVLVFLLVIWGANTEYTCSVNNETSMTFRPTVDGVTGRYRAELCTLRNPNVTHWRIDLSTYKTEHCQKPQQRLYRKPGRSHSVNEVKIEDTTNCTYVCYSMNFDLIYSGCYGIKSTLIVGEVEKPPYDTYHLINNSLTLENFTKNTPSVTVVNRDNKISLTWYLGLPATDYDISLNNLCNATDTPSTCSTEVPVNVSIACQSDELNKLVFCELAPPLGCYRASLKHRAPWTSGGDFIDNMQNVDFIFCHAAAGHAALPAPRAGGALWAGGALALLALLLLAALLASRQLAKHDYFKRVHGEWLRYRVQSESSSRAAEREAERAAGRGPIVLLSAREDELGQRVSRLLARLLERETSAPVYSLWSPRVLALAATAPHEWLRRTLGAADARVLLLQTPALAALYRSHVENLDVGAPLLGRRVLYREPQFGDALLLYALRLLAGDHRDAHHYRKYYVAQLAELPVEVFPQLVPYSRYVLPDLAADLLRDLRDPHARDEPQPRDEPRPQPRDEPRPQPRDEPRPQPRDEPRPQDQPRPQDEPQPLAELAAAVREFVRHAREKPDYLMDELLKIA